MTNTRKILIVDDDSELREALVEQLALHEEFESIAVDNGTKGIQTAKAGQIDLVIMDTCSGAQPLTCNEPSRDGQRKSARAAAGHRKLSSGEDKAAAVGSWATRSSQPESPSLAAKQN